MNDRMLRAALVLVAALASSTAVGRPASFDRSEPPRPPELDVRAPASKAAYAVRVERFDTRRLLAVMRLVGLQEAGPPISVLLAPEDSSLARHTPRWIAGFASGSGSIVLFPDRALSYPHDTIEELLQHEVAHVLIGRAAGGRPVPRWFHEGVALAAERAWSLNERAEFAYEAALGGPVPTRSLDRLFDAGQGATTRAYRLSGALVQFLLETHGPDLPARVLAAMKQGRSFDVAFLHVTRTSVDEASDAFWRRERLWTTWLPWATSPSTLYVLMTLLAIAAIARVRARRAARRREEAQGPATTDGPQPPTRPSAEEP